MATSARLKTYQWKLQLARFDVKKHKIHDTRPVQAVDGVAERPADNQPERNRGQPRRRPRQPDPEQNDRHQP